jgi:simple sugar transport system ATP-binding protein
VAEAVPRVNHAQGAPLAMREAPTTESVQAMPAQTPVLEAKSIYKAFGAVQALRGVDLHLQPGEVLGLVGDNAAGKSTFTKILAGALGFDQGRIRVDGKEVTFQSPRDARRIGIEMVYQHYALAGNLDVVANVMLGNEVRRPGLLGRLGMVDESRMEQATAHWLEEVGLPVAALRRPAELYSGGQQQAMAIARAVQFGQRVVIMDEATANLGVERVERVLSTIRMLRARGTAVILISHRMQDIFSVCDRVQIMRHGVRVADLPIQATSPQEVVQLMMGAGVADDV